MEQKMRSGEQRDFIESVFNFLKESYRADFMKADEYEKVGMEKESRDLVSRAEHTIVILSELKNEFD